MNIDTGDKLFSRDLTYDRLCFCDEEIGFSAWCEVMIRLSYWHWICQTVYLNPRTLRDFTVHGTYCTISEIATWSVEMYRLYKDFMLM